MVDCVGGEGERGGECGLGFLDNSWGNDVGATVLYDGLMVGMGGGWDWGVTYWHSLNIKIRGDFDVLYIVACVVGKRGNGH